MYHNRGIIRYLVPLDPREGGTSNSIQIYYIHHQPWREYTCMEAKRKFPDHDTSNVIANFKRPPAIFPLPSGIRFELDITERPEFEARWWSNVWILRLSSFTGPGQLYCQVRHTKASYESWLRENRQQLMTQKCLCCTCQGIIKQFIPVSAYI